jgi:hypothetical protein
MIENDEQLNVTLNAIANFASAIKVMSNATAPIEDKLIWSCFLTGYISELEILGKQVADYLRK